MVLLTLFMLQILNQNKGYNCTIVHKIFRLCGALPSLALALLNDIIFKHGKFPNFKALFSAVPMDIRKLFIYLFVLFFWIFADWSFSKLVKNGGRVS